MTIDHEGRVRALLVRAEHPETPEAEAQACAAKAAELMMRHALDEAVLRARLGEAPQPVVYWEYTVPGGDGHARARSTGLAAVVRAYGGHCAVRGDGAYRRDIALLAVATGAARDALSLLLPSLTLQMDRAGAREADTRVAEIPQELFRLRADRTRWRNGYFKSFVVGYCDVVAERIAVARGALREDAERAPSAALVPVGDEDRVRAEFAARFPVLGRARNQRLRGDGFLAGRDAGRLADIGSGTVRGSRRALTD